jgi:YVTN family beta-propeller protein
VVSTTTFAVVATLSTPGNVTALQYDPANGDVYAAFFNILNVSVYDAVTHTLTTTLALGDNALTAATYVPDSDQVILVDSYGGLYTIAGGNNTWTGPVAVDSGFIQTSIAYSAATHLVFEPEWAEFNVTGFNYTTGAAVVETYLGEDPQVAVVDPFNNVLFVANTNTNTLVAFSLVENRVLATISLSPGVDPDAIVYDPSDGLLYVAEGGTNTVTIVNPLTDAIVRAVGVGGYPFAMVYDAADNRLFVANFESANLTVISGSTGLVTGSIALTPRSAPYTETLDTVTDELYVVSFDYYTTPISSNITAVAASTGTPGPQFTIPNEVLSAGFDPTTSLLYLDSYTNLSGVWTGSLVAVDPATGATVQTLPNTEVLAPGAWDAAAGALLVPDYTSNTLEAIVGSPVLIVGSVPVGYGPFGVTIDPGYGLIFVVNQWSSSVTELSLSSTPDSLAVAADPAFCGPVSVNDSATSSAVLTSGSYPLSAPACYGYSFQGWVTTGAVAVAADALSTQVTVTGNGTVEATYSLLPGAQFAVDLGVSPASCGSAISVDGTSYGNAASAPLAPGNHTISAASCSGYLFSGWQVSGNVALLQVTGPMSADLSVVTNGTLNATYVASGSTGPGSGSTTTSGYSAVEVYALVAAGILGGALVGVLVGRRGPPRSPPRTSEPSTPSN